MKVKVRDEKGRVHVLADLSKAMDVKELKEKVSNATGLVPSKQRLFYRGKQLEDGCDLCDYKIEIGHVLQLVERQPLGELKDSNDNKQQPKVVDEMRDPVIEEQMSLLRSLCPELAAEIADLPAEAIEKVEPCKKCHDNEAKKCKECGCSECGGKELPETQLFCEQCQYVTHMHCLDPPLEQIPDGDWYCPDCYVDKNEIVQAGQKVSSSKSRAKNVTKRDWGRGHATAGCNKSCNKVPRNHFGPIPGVEVGMTWRYRTQLSEEGIHRPPVGGIHGRMTEGCYSIVLAGGYEDDVDNGDEFLYTGSGGRDLSGNKRTSGQSFDQTLDRYNGAIALNCNVRFNAKDGAEATDWRKGKPIRVVRSDKLKKHSKYAPELGNRYDGLYKVVKYWPEKGKSSFIVWRYLMRRDDPNPAPWTKDAKKFKCIFPEDHEEGIKRKAEEDKVSGDSKRPKTNKYLVEQEIKEAALLDTKNAKKWQECFIHESETKLEWIQKVEEVFGCVVCSDLLFMPITTECGHNLCKACLKRSIKAEVYSCPYCRDDLGDHESLEVNRACSNALLIIFPGYDAARK